VDADGVCPIAVATECIASFKEAGNNTVITNGKMIASPFSTHILWDGETKCEKCGHNCKYKDLIRKESSRPRAYGKRTYYTMRFFCPNCKELVDSITRCI
jgi:hypothetical protein